MLSPAPSLRSYAELEKQAYKLRFPVLGFNVQAVVAVIEVLPGLLAPPGVSVKLTALPESVTEMESFSTACSVIVLAPELSTCARELPASTVIASARTSAIRPIFACQVISMVSGG